MSGKRLIIEVSSIYFAMVHKFYVFCDLWLGKKQVSFVLPRGDQRVAIICVVICMSNYLSLRLIFSDSDV